MALVGFREEAHLAAFEASPPRAWTSKPRPITDFLRPYTFSSNKDLFLVKPEAFAKCGRHPSSSVALSPRRTCVPRARCRTEKRENAAVVLGADASPPFLGVTSPTVSYGGPGSIGTFVVRRFLTTS